ncbi:GIY-YIG nuclease family protein [Kitasatospora sp. NPDC094011]|uniref:GIY-YIG nuclease family protein n=1 Tax=Kitasatospora sp. NPDC094011 TaxID=3364090 RepID=UPI003812EBE5
MHTTEFVYVLRNPAFSEFVKIGFTTHLPEDRIRKLNTGVPYPFELAFQAVTLQARRVEQAVHRLLKENRAPNGEFFRISADDAEDAIRRCQKEVTGIRTWAPMPTIHRLRAADRLALPLKAGDMFVLTAYRNIFRDRQAEILDLWQAHADGDLLEIAVTNDPGHVAGLSDGDPGGDEDPVPFLDRHNKALNGQLIGRERLVSGDRLIWLSDVPEDPARCTCVVFEADGHAQVTLRTWDPQPNPSHPLGLPLTLNDWVREPTPAMVPAIREVLALRVPGTWAPRNPDPAHGWAIPATRPQAPEYWLPQLRKRS